MASLHIPNHIQQHLLQDLFPKKNTDDTCVGLPKVSSYLAIPIYCLDKRAKHLLWDHDIQFELHAESAIQIGIIKIGFIQSLLNYASSLSRVRHNATPDCLYYIFCNPNINAQTTTLSFGQDQMPPMCACDVIGNRKTKAETGPLVLIAGRVKAGKGF